MRSKLDFRANVSCVILYSFLLEEKGIRINRYLLAINIIKLIINLI